jgi:hypothetical protein
VLVEIVPESVAELASVFERFGRSTEALWDEFSDAELEVVHRFLQRATAFLQTAAARLGNDRAGAGR